VWNGGVSVRSVGQHSENLVECLSVAENPVEHEAKALISSDAITTNQKSITQKVKMEMGVRKKTKSWERDGDERVRDETGMERDKRKKWIKKKSESEKIYMFFNI
jgi:hypothetical protein